MLIIMVLIFHLLFTTYLLPCCFQTETRAKSRSPGESPKYSPSPPPSSPRVSSTRIDSSLLSDSSDLSDSHDSSDPDKILTINQEDDDDYDIITNQV